MTLALAAVLGLLFCAGLYLGDGRIEAGTSHMGALRGTEVEHGAWWLLVSAMFLHWSITHIAMNGLALLNLAPLVERVFGARRLLIAFVLCGIGGNALVAFVKPDQLEAGASSSIWGLLGLIGVLSLRPGGLIPEQTAAALRPGILRAIVINAAISLLPGVSGLAHLGGAITGAALGFLPWFRQGIAEKDEPSSIVFAAYLAGAAALAGIGLGIWHGIAPAQ